MKCKATTKSGNPCKANAMRGSDYCVTHARILSGEKKAKAPLSKPILEPNATGSQEAQTNNNSMKMGEFSMEERRKNVSLVSGMALLLAIAAILLFGWSQIAYSPLQQGDQDTINGKLDHLGKNLHRLDDQFNEFLSTDKKAWQLYQLKNLQNTVDFLNAAGSEQYKADFDKIQGDITALIAKIEGPNAAASADCPMAKSGDCPKAKKGECPKAKAAKAKAAKAKAKK